MSDRTGIFEGDNPFQIVRDWLSEARESEINDPNAMALATVDARGMPNARTVLLKDIEEGAFVFYTNYESAKADEIAATGTAAFVIHWKSLRRQIRARGHVTREDGPQADRYYASRPLQARIGAWASQQSRPLESRAGLAAEVDRFTQEKGADPARPPYWGGFRITPVELEFWADGPNRLHDRFRWTRDAPTDENWTVTRLNP